MSDLLPLKNALEIIENLEIPYMVTGSFAGIFHGFIRTTRDLDVVIDPTRETLETLVSAFMEKGYYASGATARAAYLRRTQFNVIDIESSWKIDLIFKKNRPFSETEFSRRVPGGIDVFEAVIATAEDTILSKLEWAKKGNSEHQLLDVKNIAQSKRDILDFDYLNRWARELGVIDLLEKTLNEL